MGIDWLEKAKRWVANLLTRCLMCNCIVQFPSHLDGWCSDGVVEDPLAEECLADRHLLLTLEELVVAELLVEGIQLVLHPMQQYSRMEWFNACLIFSKLYTLLSIRFSVRSLVKKNREVFIVSFWNNQRIHSLCRRFTVKRFLFKCVVLPISG